MKAIIVLLILGVSFSVYLFVLGKSTPDGVVVEKPYESAIRFEDDRKDILSLKDAIDNFTVTRKDGKIYFNFDIYPEKSEYTNINIKEAFISPFIGNPIPLKEEGGSYVASAQPQSGWYNINVTVNADNKTVTVTNAVHID